MKPLKLIVPFLLIVNLFAKSEVKQSTTLFANSLNYTPITLEKKLNNNVNTIIFQSRSRTFENEECLQTITGKISNKLSGEILNNTKVTIYLNGEEDRSLKVGVDGTYNFKIKCNANYYIKVHKLNFINDIYEFKTTSKNNKIIIHDFVLEPECIQTISGNILDKETKKPISANLKLYINNVEVETFKIKDDGSYFIKFQCVTNYRIVASKPYYFNDSYYFLTDYIENKQPNYFHLKKDLFLKRNDCYQQISGTVLDVNTHTIIPNSTVSLYYQNTKIKSFKTNENGSYSFKANCNLNYELRIFKDNNFVKTINVKTSSLKNINTKQDIYLGVTNCRQVVNGMVISEKTKARLINTQITLFEGKTKIKKIITDGNGTFSFGLNCNSSYKIIASNSKYFTTSINFDTEKRGNITVNKTIELNLLDCSQTVNGIVLDKVTKLPIANTQVVLLEKGYEVLKTITNNHGKFFFNVNCASKYEIVTTHKKYKTNSIKLAINKARNTTNSISFNLEKKDCSQIITGIIRDKTTKKPLPNTAISLYQNNNVVSSYTVGEDGVYTLKLNCSSTYKLSVFKNNYLESFQLKTDNQNNQILNLNIDIEALSCENYIKGVVKENITNNPIPNTSVFLKFNSKEIKQTLTDSIGAFYFNAKCRKPYTVFVTKLNYTKQTILLSDKNNLDYNLDLSIEPIIPFKEKNGIKYIETKPIIFGLDEFKINTKIKLELNKVIYNMNQNPSIKIEINYYTDSRGPDDYNLQLSIKRANATKDYLISKGIDSNRIKATGFGETKLLNKCKNNVKCSDAEHAINRRTEFIVTKK
ncbi:OmpA family protein [Lutibacter sp.]|uniref:OmpA family protein n=1 Tax=Lutibacter sp. TaxID=1925666 RepID=UPI0025C1B4A1|nr:OmpA family protein [Lutibacter sp.]MCF6167101.1 OmpA family protein [Lutibacter sp.]